MGLNHDLGLVVWQFDVPGFTREPDTNPCTALFLGGEVNAARIEREIGVKVGCGRMEAHARLHHHRLHGHLLGDIPPQVNHDLGIELHLCLVSGQSHDRVVGPNLGCLGIDPFPCEAGFRTARQENRDRVGHGIGGIERSDDVAAGERRRDGFAQRLPVLLLVFNQFLLAVVLFFAVSHWNGLSLAGVGVGLRFRWMRKRCDRIDGNGCRLGGWTVESHLARAFRPIGLRTGKRHPGREYEQGEDRRGHADQSHPGSPGVGGPVALHAEEQRGIQIVGIGQIGPNGSRAANGDDAAGFAIMIGGGRFHKPVHPLIG